MISCITNNIEIIVRSSYQEQSSSPEFSNYVFAYEITIINKGQYAVQLLAREWKIKEAMGIVKLIKGMGVVGEQPVLQPNQKYTYISGCNFQSEIGIMQGQYDFVRLFDEQPFKVKIPKFNLVFPPNLN